MDETTISTRTEYWLSSSINNMTSNLSQIENQEISTQLFPNEFSSFTRTQLTLAAVLTIIIMTIGIFGNFLTIIALIKCPKVRNVAAAFIISLCLADCIFCALVLPFNTFRFIKGSLEHKGFLCRLIPLMQYGNIGVSLLCIAMITINRYVMIAHHSAYAKIYKKHWIGVMIAFCWLFAYGMQIPTFLGVWGAFGYDDKLGTCSIIPDEAGHSSKTVLFIIAFVIPCVIIIGCYAKIFWVIHQSEKRLRKHASKQNSVLNNGRPSSTGINPSRISVTSSSVGEIPAATTFPSKVKGKRNEWRITKMVLVIFLSFIICYLPITIVKVADKNVRYPGFHMLGYIMLYMSACVNPIIYVIINKQYRQAYKSVLLCKNTLLTHFTQGGNGSSQPQGEMERREVQPHFGIAGFIARSTPIQFQHSDSTTHHYAGAKNREREEKNRLSINKQQQLSRQYYCESEPPKAIISSPSRTSKPLKGNGGMSRNANSDYGPTRQKYERSELSEWHSR